MNFGRTLLFSVVVLVSAGCSDDPIAERGTPLPDLNEITEPIGDWSLLSVLVDRRPADSQLLLQSPITVDLNAVVGPGVFDYRQRMAKAGPLVRDGELLVAVTPQGPDAAYLVIDEPQRAIEAGWKKDGRWHVERTAGSEIRRPRPVQLLVAG